MSSGIDRELAEYQAVANALKARGWEYIEVENDFQGLQNKVIIGRGDLVLTACVRQPDAKISDILRGLLELVEKQEVAPGRRYAAMLPMSIAKYDPGDYSSISCDIIDIDCSISHRFRDKEKGFLPYSNDIITTSSWSGNYNTYLYSSTTLYDSTSNPKPRSTPAQPETSLAWLDRRISEIRKLVRAA